MASILDLTDDSSDSENDLDYIPSDDDASELSLCENTDEEEPAESDLTSRRKKRKKGKKTNLHVNKEDNAAENDEGGGESKSLNEEDEKKRAESLWQDFLQDVTPPVRKRTENSSEISKTVVANSSTVTQEKRNQEPKKVTVSEVFEFAGESVVVTKEVEQNSQEAKRVEKSASPAVVEKQSLNKELQQVAPVKRPAGISSVLGAIMNKRQKLSTLQKSMLDWKSFKQDEGIEEELDQHRRGKDSYVEKQAFLQRSDLRQFEIEKNIRLRGRSNR